MQYFHLFPLFYFPQLLDDLLFYLSHRCPHNNLFAMLNSLPHEHTFQEIIYLAGNSRIGFLVLGIEFYYD